VGLRQERKWVRELLRQPAKSLMSGSKAVVDSRFRSCNFFLRVWGFWLGVTASTTRHFNLSAPRAAFNFKGRTHDRRRT
jgi:hypothetical protein